MFINALALASFLAAHTAAAQSVTSTPTLPISRSYQSLVLSVPYPPTVTDTVPWLVEGVVVTDADPEGQAQPVPSFYELFAGCKNLGVFIVALTVREDGTVRNPRIVRSPGCAAADQRVLKAVLAWRYYPARKKGRAVSSRITVTIAAGG